MPILTPVQAHPLTTGKTYFRKGGSHADFSVIDILSTNPTLTTYRCDEPDLRKSTTFMLENEIANGTRIARNLIAKLESFGLNAAHWRSVLEHNVRLPLALPDCSSKQTVTTIRLERYEGLVETSSHDSFAKANACLRQWALAVPETADHDGVTCTAIWQDGHTLTVNIDLGREHATDPLPLTHEILSRQLYLSGRRMPLRLIEPQKYLSRIASHREQALHFLDTYALVDAP